MLQLASRLRLLLIVLSARWLLKSPRTWKSLDPHASRTADWLPRYGWVVTDDIPYSPSLAPSDFDSFGPLRKHLAGDLQQTSTWSKLPPPCLHTFDTDFFLHLDTRLDVTVVQMLKYQGWLHEVWSVSSATYVPCTRRSDSKVSDIGVFVNLVLKLLCRMLSFPFVNLENANSIKSLIQF